MNLQKNFLYLAQRYLFTKHHESSIRFMIKICYISITIATFALSLVIAVMAGFEQATYQKMQSIYPDLIIATHNNAFDLQILKQFQGANNHNVAYFAPEKQMQAFLCNIYDLNNPATIVMRAINAQEYNQVSNLQSKIQFPKDATIDSVIHKNTILIGSELAATLHLNIADQALLMHCVQQEFDTCLEFEHTLVHIGGIFKTGIQELDATLIWCDMHWIDETIEDLDIDQIHIKVNNPKYDRVCLQSIIEKIPCDIYSWKDLYPTLLSALKLEKYAMGLILFLIVIIASMNIIALITMFINQKRKDIAILRCYNMSIQNIIKIFITMSVYIATIASSTGLILSWITGRLLQMYPCIKLPDNVYDSDFLPVKLEFLNFFVIFIATIIIAIIATMFATKRIKQIKINEILKS